jgi:hypothetical protein
MRDEVKRETVKRIRNEGCAIEFYNRFKVALPFRERKSRTLSQLLCPHQVPNFMSRLYAADSRQWDRRLTTIIMVCLMRSSLSPTLLPYHPGCTSSLMIASPTLYLWKMSPRKPA